MYMHVPVCVYRQAYVCNSMYVGLPACTCMYQHVCTCMYVCMYKYVYTSTSIKNRYVCTGVYVTVCMYRYVSKTMYILACMYKYIHVCTSVYVPVWIYRHVCTVMYVENYAYSYRPYTTIYSNNNTAYACILYICIGCMKYNVQV